MLPKRMELDKENRVRPICTMSPVILTLLISIISSHHIYHLRVYLIRGSKVKNASIVVIEIIKGKCNMYRDNRSYV